MCCEFTILSTSGLSSTTKIRSKRDKIGDGRSICSPIDLYWSNLPNFGFAAASTEQREFNVAIIPAFAMDIVCCSRAS